MVSGKDQRTQRLRDDNQGEGVAFGEELLVYDDEVTPKTNGVGFKIWEVRPVDVRSDFGGPHWLGIGGESFKKTGSIGVGAVGLCPVGRFRNRKDVGAEALDWHMRAGGMPGGDTGAEDVLREAASGAEREAGSEAR